MLFNSFQFLIFFPVVTALYFLFPHRIRWALLLLASCVFYMAFIPAYILILAATIVVDYFAGIYIAESEGKRRKWLLILSIVTNVGFLAFFKYFNFFGANLNALAEFLHWNYSIEALAIVLPVGLSFHTFQAMSYTIEVYRGVQKPERHFGIYALYVMFFPQLVAGPIERPQNLLHQFREEHTVDLARIGDGLRLMLWGFFKKVVVADTLATGVNVVFNNPADFTGISYWVATIFFAFQIYCDFSGYSDIARGAARVLGFRLMLNFNRPYTSRSVAEFWKRWHISLSTWFRDYLYIPLGGSRVSVPRWYANLLIVFLVSGLWHGANWTFVIWGALHGVYLVSSLAFQKWRDTIARLTRLDSSPKLRSALAVLVTFLLVNITWIFFRAHSLDDALYILRGLFSDMSPSSWDAYSLTLTKGRMWFVECILALFLMEAVETLRTKPKALAYFVGRTNATRWSAYAFVGLLILLASGSGGSEFIYFQF